MADIPIPVATTPSAIGTKSRGMTSRTRLYDSATMPTRAPCAARPASMSSKDGATALSRLPNTNTAASTMMTRFLPTLSETFPISGMRVAPARVTMEMTHATLSVRNSSAMCGTAGYTIRISKVAISENKMMTPSMANSCRLDAPAVGEAE